jgi:GNAT superfamily N-acetyltransferase
MNITINQAQLNNHIAITNLTHELGYSTTEDQTYEWLSYLLRSKDHQVFVATTDNGTLCGWIVVEKRISLEAGFKAEITGLVVGASFRRFGVGKQLVAAAISWVHELKLQKLVVRSNIQREDSHEFYKDIGFSFKKSAHNYELLL